MPSSFFSPSTSTLATPGPATPVLNKAHPIAPLSINLDLDGIHTTSGHKEVDPWSGRTRKRKREASLGHIQRSPLDSPESHNFTSVTDASAATRPTPTPPEHYARPWKSKRADPISNPDCGGYMSDSPPTPHRRLRAQRRDPIASTSTPSSHHTGYETDQPFSSVPLRLSSGKMTAQEQYQGSDRELSLLLQPPPTPSGGPPAHTRQIGFVSP
ncbi:hypothetical protein F5148DRAFT_366913 [Russula earlei]|uniref:Uncharacterized protein n=1 Tax=Russula earlei TaxID=71964 RepID=A0ACC0U237_9AGAM|nr:hypothetical protein F5148DRAFT_366913 [Russula earlei]